MTDLCPHCGYNLTADAVLSVAGWALDPRGSVTFRERRLDLTKSEVALLYTLAKANGRTLEAGLIGERISEAENVENLARVLVVRIRAKCAQAHIPVPFETVWRRGYRWCATDLAEAA